MCPTSRTEGFGNNERKSVSIETHGALWTILDIAPKLPWSDRYPFAFAFLLLLLLFKCHVFKKVLPYG